MSLVARFRWASDARVLPAVIVAFLANAAIGEPTRTAARSSVDAQNNKASNTAEDEDPVDESTAESPLESTAESTASSTAQPTRGLFGLDAAPIDEPLVTDRPDFTESPEVIPRGRFQLEAGYTFTYDRERKDRVRDHTLPEILLRAGLADRWELRLGWPGYSITELTYEDRSPAGRRIFPEEWVNGANDFSLGFKLRLLDQEGVRPNFAVIGEMTMPSGSPSLSSADVDPKIKLLWSYDLGERFALSGNVNVGAPTEDGHRFVQAEASLSLGVSLSERWGAYLEYFGAYPNAHSTDAAHSVNGGLTFLVTKDLQLDFRAGAGLNEEADDFFAGLGFAWRF